MVGAGEEVHMTQEGETVPGEGGKPHGVHKATRHMISLGLVHASAELT